MVNSYVVMEHPATGLRAGLAIVEATGGWALRSMVFTPDGPAPIDGPAHPLPYGALDDMTAQCAKLTAAAWCAV